MNDELAKDVLEAESEQDQITAEARTISALGANRRHITMDDLAHMIDITPRLEYRTPRTYPVDGVQKYAWIFSIDGRLNGAELKGCSLGDDFAVVFAATEAQARTLAHEGILATTMHSYEHWYSENVEGNPYQPDDGIIEDVGGRKMKAPRERSQIADIVGDVFKKVN